MAEAADLESYQLAVALKESGGVRGAVGVMNAMVRETKVSTARA